MRVFYDLQYAVTIELVRTFYLKSVPAKFQIYLKHISWVISVTSSSKLSCNPRHPSRNISCNHRHHLLQPSWRRIFSASNNQKTRVDSDINNDYRASSFDRLYIWCRKWDTASFVRAHQRKYWNDLTFGRGHDDDGCNCNHRAVPPSDIDEVDSRKPVDITKLITCSYCNCCRFSVYAKNFHWGVNKFFFYDDQMYNNFCNLYDKCLWRLSFRVEVICSDIYVLVTGDHFIYVYLYHYITILEYNI